MTAKEFHHSEAGNEESTLLQVDPYEEEETLSLSDLPIYSGSVSARWETGGGDFSKEDGKNSGDDDDDDNLFEFFSEEFTSSTNTYTTAENIIFCGKLIPFKDVNPPRAGQSNNINNVQKGNIIAKRSSKGSNKGFACDYYSSSVEKVSLVRSPTKSRWFLFMFGMPKLSTTTGMELKDIKNRQSRRRRPSTTMFPAPENGKKEGVKEKKSTSCKGVWKTLKSISLVLGCHSSKIANNVVKAAFV